MSYNPRHTANQIWFSVTFATATVFTIATNFVWQLWQECIAKSWKIGETQMKIDILHEKVS